MRPFGLAVLKHSPHSSSRAFFLLSFIPFHIPYLLCERVMGVSSPRGRVSYSSLRGELSVVLRAFMNSLLQRTGVYQDHDHEDISPHIAKHLALLIRCAC